MFCSFLGEGGVLYLCALVSKRLMLATIHPVTFSLLQNNQVSQSRIIQLNEIIPRVGYRTTRV
jgi:hypothetical protein